MVIRVIQETFERRICSDGNQLQIRNLACVKLKPRHVHRFFNESLSLEACYFTINQCSPVGLDQFHLRFFPWLKLESYLWRPHSVLSVPRQRPARGSSPIW